MGIIIVKPCISDVKQKTPNYFITVNEKTYAHDPINVTHSEYTLNFDGMCA